MHAGLSLLNLSLDTLRPERFERMTRRRGHDRVLETLDLALTLGFDPVKVRLGAPAVTSLWASWLRQAYTLFASVALSLPGTWAT